MLRNAGTEVSRLLHLLTLYRPFPVPLPRSSCLGRHGCLAREHTRTREHRRSLDVAHEFEPELAKPRVAFSSASYSGVTAHGTEKMIDWTWVVGLLGQG